MINYIRSVSLFEMLLVVSLTLSFSFILSQTNDLSMGIPVKKESDFIGLTLSIYKFIIKLALNEKTLVSAAENLGSYTCVKAKDGSVCQAYPVLSASDVTKCNAQCDGACIPKAPNEVSECKIGTCYNPNDGYCSAGSPKQKCEGNKGQWFDDPLGNNIPQCKRGCCVLGDNVQFLTPGQCKKQSDLFGIEKDFRPEITTELQCLVLAKTQEQGACVFESEFENTCKFTTKAQCLEIGGDFYSGLLCSNSDLKTNCERQKEAKCVEGLDEVYWFDSCGNKENIYDANKGKSWNDGKVLPKTESCQLGSANNPFNNQDTCGNCNYLIGSTCGDKTASEKLADGSQQFVCKDLRCKDVDEKLRENGESWCSYQGAIGVDKGIGKGSSGNLLRSIDTPGSRHFRQTCLDGEVRTEPCADYRNEICVEAQTDKSVGGTFSSAACRINRWQECLNYNTETAGKKGDALKKAQNTRDDKCTNNIDCFVKEINIDKNFKFNICAPKYPSGFDLTNNGEGAENVCSLASQTCTVIYVKKISGWKCVANCNCKKAGFTQQMNDLCMSLGDCGASANYIGDLTTDGYNVKKAPKLNSAYLTGLVKYADVIKGKYAEPGNLSKFYGELGIPDGLGNAKKPADASAGAVNMALVTSGVIGVGLLALAHVAPFAIGGLGLGAGGFLGGIGAGSVAGGIAGGAGAASAGSSGLAGIAPTIVPGLNPSAISLGGALMGAAIGLAVTSLMIKFLGIGAGLGTFETYALLAAGAVVGAMIGYSFVTYGSLCAIPGACIAAVAIIIILLVLKFVFGIGKTKKEKVVFTCGPWQAPLGGAKCEQCGKDGLTCSSYSCSALGQTCGFINEGTGNELCIDINPNDAAAPRISPLQSVLSEGFAYTSASDNGVVIKGTTSEECVKASSPLTFGIALNEPGQCRFDVVHTNRYEEMEFEFGGRTLFLFNHTQVFAVPNLESLGLPGFDPNRRSEYNLYVRCRDKTGNENVNEYTINFCVKPGDDSTAPIIISHDPAREFTAYNATKQEVDVYVNEPAECRWSETDKDYDQMENNLLCTNGFDDQELRGFKCQGELPIGEGENKFYVRCKDQPWLIEDTGNGNSGIIVEDGPTEAEIEQADREAQDTSGGITGNVVLDESSEDEDNGDSINDFNEEDFVDEVSTNRTIELNTKRTRNKNSQSYIISYKRTASNLKIDSMRPDNETLIFGNEPASVKLEVSTSGGIDGSSTCKYAIAADYLVLTGDAFIPPGVKDHSVVLQLFGGEHDLFVQCVDDAGNMAEKLGKFNVHIDIQPPIVTRVYDQSGSLVVITNENSECAFTVGTESRVNRGNKCNFDFDDGNITLMSGNQLTHSTSFDSTLTHYIKCKDTYGNLAGTCNLIVRGGV